MSFTPKGKGTNLNVALRALNDIVRKSSTVFLFSDFFDSGYEKLLKISHKKHDMVGIIVEDRVESRFPKAGLVILEDAESDQFLSFNSSQSGFSKRYEKESSRRKEARRRLFTSIGMDSIEVFSDASYVDPLIRFFKMREKRARYS